MEFGYTRETGSQRTKLLTHHKSNTLKWWLIIADCEMHYVTFQNKYLRGVTGEDHESYNNVTSSKKCLELCCFETRWDSVVMGDVGGGLAFPTYFSFQIRMSVVHLLKVSQAVLHYECDPKWPAIWTCGSGKMDPRPTGWTTWVTFAERGAKIPTWHSASLLGSSSKSTWCDWLQSWSKPGDVWGRSTKNMSVLCSRPTRSAPSEIYSESFSIDSQSQNLSTPHHLILAETTTPEPKKTPFVTPKYRSTLKMVPVSEDGFEKQPPLLGSIGGECSSLACYHGNQSAPWKTENGPRCHPTSVASKRVFV